MAQLSAKIAGRVIPCPRESPESSKSGREFGRLAIKKLVICGEPAVLLERGARSLVTFPAISGEDRWGAALAQLVDRGRIRRIEIAKVDGEALTAEHPVTPVLEAAGFVRSYRGWAYARRSRARG